jgi:hypothetical protein
MELLISILEILLNASRRIDIPVFAVNATDEPFFYNGLLTVDCTSNAALAASGACSTGPVPPLTRSSSLTPVAM